MNYDNSIIQENAKASLNELVNAIEYLTVLQGASVSCYEQLLSEESVE